MCWWFKKKDCDTPKCSSIQPARKPTWYNDILKNYIAPPIMIFAAVVLWGIGYISFILATPYLIITERALRKEYRRLCGGAFLETKVEHKIKEFWEQYWKEDKSGTCL